MRERSEEKAENKKRPDVDKYHVTVLRRSFVCVKISYLGSLSFSLSKGRKGKKLSLSKNSILWERKRVAQQIEISSFSSIWWRSKLLQRCCKNTHFFVCWIIIVIIFSSCYGLSGESLGLWIFHDVEFSLNDSIHAGFLRRELIRGCGSEVKLILTFLVNWFMVSFCLMILLIGFYFILIMYFILPFEIVKLLPFFYGLIVHLFLWFHCNL